MTCTFSFTVEFNKSNARQLFFLNKEEYRTRENKGQVCYMKKEMK